MPCFPRQRAKAIGALEQWSRFKPSRPGSANLIDFHVMYSSNESPGEFASRVTELAHKMFANVTFVQQRLTRLQDVYPRATFVHFLDAVVHAHAQGYSALTLLEPDVVVLRSHWIDALLSTLNGPERWWIRGSAWLGSPRPWSNMKRTNGNAIYRVDDEEAIHFFQWALRYEWSRQGYDHSLWLAHDELMESCTELRHLSSRLQYTSLIVNLGRGCHTINATHAHMLYPDAFLAHISC